MVTIFCTCKPFVGDDIWRQMNALKSWFLFTSSVILFGKDWGVKRVADELGCIHVPDVECNEYGRPYVNAMFRRVQGVSHDSHLCYIDADNMVAGLPKAFDCVAQKFSRFLLLGKRWDWAYPDEIETIENREWCAHPMKVSLGWWNERREGFLHNEWAMDYFGFSRGLFHDLPPFLAGWPGWDNWLVLHALQLEIPIVDVTKVVTCVHHGHSSSWRGNKDNPQHRWNLDLASDLLVPGARGSVEAAPWVLQEDGEIRAR